ncbi:MAG: GDP-mannose 4,6-dehydratase [Aggregatilineales bacterium]
MITGINGFVGTHLTRYLQSVMPFAELHGTIFNGKPENLIDKVNYHQLDLKDTDRVNRLIREAQPDLIFHLAAYAFVPDSFVDPWQTLENNMKSQLNLFEACRLCDIQPKIFITSSATVYGSVQPDEIPLTENAPLRPSNPYALSKIVQETMALQYQITYGWHVVCARLFNHIGPGQNANFVAPAFAQQIAQIEVGTQEPVIRVGDLSDKRDFIDVRDAVRAYKLILENGASGEIYNIASGRSYRIQFILDHLIRHSSHKNIRVEVDKSLLRSTSTPILQGDYTKLHKATGWSPEIPIEQTLEDILNDARQRIRKNE